MTATSGDEPTPSGPAGRELVLPRVDPVNVVGNAVFLTGASTLSSGLINGFRPVLLVLALPMLVLLVPVYAAVARHENRRGAFLDGEYLVIPKGRNTLAASARAILDVRRSFDWNRGFKVEVEINDRRAVDANGLPVWWVVVAGVRKTTADAVVQRLDAWCRGVALRDAGVAPLREPAVADLPTQAAGA